MKAAAIEVPVVSFAMNDRDADVYAERVKYSTWETEVLIRTPLGKLQASMARPTLVCWLLGSHAIPEPQSLWLASQQSIHEQMIGIGGMVRNLGDSSVCAHAVAPARVSRPSCCNRRSSRRS